MCGHNIVACRDRERARERALNACAREHTSERVRVRARVYARVSKLIMKYRLAIGGDHHRSRVCHVRDLPGVALRTLARKQAPNIRARTRAIEDLTFDAQRRAGMRDSN